MPTNDDLVRLVNKLDNFVLLDDSLLGPKAPEGVPKAFLCLPYDGDTEAYMAKVYCIIPEVKKRGMVLLTPYAIFASPKSKNLVDLETMRFIAWKTVEDCDEFWVMSDRLSYNVLVELTHAMSLGKKLVYLNPSSEVKSDE